MAKTFLTDDRPNGGIDTVRQAYEHEAWLRQMERQLLQGRPQIVQLRVDWTRQDIDRRLNRRVQQ